jgi:hypothetical protein
MSTKLHGVTSQQGKHVAAVSSLDLNLMQTTIRYLNLQSHINQILAEISRTSWVSHNMRSHGGDYDVNCHLGPATVGQEICNTVWEEPAASINLMMEAAGTLKRRSISARLHGVTTENISAVRPVWCAQDRNSNNFHIYTLSKLCFIQSIRVTNALCTEVFRI